MGEYCAITEEGTKPGVGKKKKKRGSIGESFAVVRSSPKVRGGLEQLHAMARVTAVYVLARALPHAQQPQRAGCSSAACGGEGGGC